MRGVDARFRLPHAIEIAEKGAPGRATVATFSPFPTGGGSLEVTVARPDGTFVKYRVDANTGELVNVTEQKLEGYVSQLDPKELASSKTNMTQALAAAESRVEGGTAIGAEAEDMDGRIGYQVSVLKDGAETEYRVDPDGAVSVTDPIKSQTRDLKLL